MITEKKSKSAKSLNRNKNKNGHRYRTHYIKLMNVACEK